MNKLIERLAYKIGEGLQASSLSNIDIQKNVFHRGIVAHESSDLSFINGLLSTGLRGSAILEGDILINNHNQLLTASRQHLPLVVNTSARLSSATKYATSNNYGNINAIQNTGCFQLIATTPQEEIFFTLIAHRIAELSLIPGIIIADYTTSSDQIDIPSDSLIKEYLGDPDSQIECPTPAQKMIFGQTRRRIPNWFSLDLPIMLGAKKEGSAIAFEAAASQKYFYDHLPQLIERSFSEFKDILGTEINLVSGSDKSEYAIVSYGGQLKELTDHNSGELKNVDSIIINQLNPFPLSEVTTALKGKKAVTILENISDSGTVASNFFNNISLAVSNTNTKIYQGQFSSEFNISSLVKAIEHMVTNKEKLSYFLEVEFTKSSSEYPKHDILLNEISKEYPGLANNSISGNLSNEKAPKSTYDVPLAVRMYHDKGPIYSRLSRFYDNTAFFFEHKMKSELVADPFAAVPITPSASASFFNYASKRQYLPALNTEKCTGCGECFVQCPHAALPATAIGVEQLMKAGIDLASASGLVITKLPPLLKNLAKVATASIKEVAVKSVQDFLPSAFDSLASQMNLVGEKLQEAKSEFDAVLVEIANLPLAVTDQFYNTPSLYEVGSGELFTLTVNPTTCTGCGICAEVCEEDALSMVLQNEENLSLLNTRFKLWEHIPDTTGDTINRLTHDESYSSLAAIMLSRSFYMAMSGASDTEADNPYKTLLHIVSAATESVVQPRIIKQLKLIEELVDTLSENIHSELSNALPKENLDGLSKSLKRARGGKVSLQEVISQITGNENSKLFDSSVLGRKTNLVDDLKDLKWSLSEGPSGVGRSRFGMLLAGSNSMEWAKQYPSNNFTSPTVIHWHGSAPEQTLGLFYGQLRYLIDNIKLIRRAELESKNKYDPHVHDAEIASLTWQDLSEDEKKLIPPVILVGERDDLNEAGWSSLNKLLAEKYPLKVFLFDHIASSKNDPVANLTQTISGLFSSIALKNAYVFQGGMGNVDHLYNGLISGLDKTSPALFNLYATKLENHKSEQINWTPYASLALTSRAFPALSYDPEVNSNFLKGAVDLDGNKAYKSAWVEEEILVNNDQMIDYKITWADWAFTQSNWESEFNLVESSDSNVMVPDYVQLDANSRKSKNPVIVRAGDQALKYYSVSEAVIEMTAAVLANWQTWQELAGLLTQFPAKLKKEVTEELSMKFDQEIKVLKEDYERELKEKEAAFTEKIRTQIKNKLVELSTLAKN